ncbi:YadA C-terminal domain-containing protein [Prochlorococcus marinus]|uniref:YadA C-terminal domain-containing protein n=1 Tax=Prochlorococcus marinus TaxID=1219 RepID=UPI001ADADECF|nr:YadA C-terminal domain-containing protein [Prochlorococcus marinus]MBO8218251.1 hypothetical protein [Prochlorococcus marinus CUG1416]MBW3050662.1 hypothetical protein [Prochlorococcus marinus str. MU1416]
MLKTLKKIFTSLFSSTLLITPLSSLAGEVSTATSDLGYFVSSENTGSETQVHLYKLAADGAASIIISNIFPDSTTNSFSATDYTVDQQKGKIYFLEPPRSGNAQRRIRIFDMDTNAFEGFTNITNLPGSGSPMFIDIPVKMENLADKKCNTTSASCGATDTKFISLGGSGTDELLRIDDDGISTGGTNSATLVKNNSDGSVQIGADGNDVDVVADGLNIDGQAIFTKNSDGSIQIGADGNDIDITAEGLSIDGNPMITKQADGNIHIGKNSLITPEDYSTLSDGTKVHHLWAEDDSNNKIPINIYGSKLLIDGVEVIAGDSAQVTTNKNNISTNTSNISSNTSNIKNLGEGVAGSTALTAALTALPQTSKESKLSCGVGTGAYSSRYALGFGCASKVNARVDINAGGSYVFGGSKSYGEGTLDNGVIKAGFVFKLGELKKSTQISMKEKEELKQEISDLKANNINIIVQNKALLARLERLEKVALGKSKSQDLATIKLP